MADQSRRDFLVGLAALAAAPAMPALPVVEDVAFQWSPYTFAYSTVAIALDRETYDEIMRDFRPLLSYHDR
jgi:hypothetical protein